MMSSKFLLKNRRKGGRSLVGNLTGHLTNLCDSFNTIEYFFQL